MKKMLFLVTLLVLISCGHSISEVKVGMTSAEVKELLGEANQTSSSSSSSSFNNEETSSFSTSTWTYDGKGKVVFENDIVVTVESN